VIFKRPTGCSFLFLDGVYINFSTPKIKKERKSFQKRTRKISLKSIALTTPLYSVQHEVVGNSSNLVAPAM